MTITGATRLFPIIGHPVSGVFSPPAFNLEFQNKGLDVTMVPMDIPPSALNAFWDLLRSSQNMVGCSVTYPHKQAAFAAMDQLTPRAGRLGAVNTVRCQEGRLIGDATDGLAMCSAILKVGAQIAGRSAVVVGAGGGAGVAIVDALCADGLRRLTVSETDEVRRRAVLDLLARDWPEVEISANQGPSDILINATTLGKNPDDECPFSEDAVRAATVVGDVVTHSCTTPLVALSQRLGVDCVTGDDMGRGQIAAQLSFLGY